MPVSGPSSAAKSIGRFWEQLPEHFRALMEAKRLRSQEVLYEGEDAALQL